MSQHDSHPGSATGSTRPRSVPPGSPAPSARASRPVGGVEPISLRGAVDVRAAEARLAALGQSRSTSALGERADLLRTLGRLDEALAIAEEAFRLAHFTGDRADSTAARIRRAHVLREQGKLERALGDLHTSRITASTEEWRELEATAAELEGYTLFDLGRIDESSEALDAALTAYAQAGVARDRLEALRSVVDELMRAAADGPAHARETGGVTPIGQGTVGAHAAVDAEPQLPSRAARPAAAPAQPTASPASPPEEGDTNPTGLPRVDGARVDAARVDGARVDQGEGGAQPSPTTAEAPAPQAPAPVEPALAAAMRTDPGDAPAASSAPAAPSEPVLDKPSTRADTSLWGKISSLAANAAGHRDRDGERAVVVDAPHVDDDEPRRGATGVTGVVEGLPRDDEPTTWPFPGR